MSSEGQQIRDVTPSSAPATLKAALAKRPPKAKEDRKSKKEDQKIFGDAERKEHTKQVLHKLVIVLLWIGAACFYAVLIARVLHFILPEVACDCWTPRCWLTPEQLQGIDKFFFSGALGAAIAKYLKDNVGVNDGGDDSDGGS